MNNSINGITWILVWLYFKILFHRNKKNTSMYNSNIFYKPNNNVCITLYQDCCIKNSEKRGIFGNELK